MVLCRVRGVTKDDFQADQIDATLLDHRGNGRNLPLR